MAGKILDVGLAIAVSQLTGATSTPPRFLAWGTGSTAATATDTGLETASAEARTSGTLTEETTTVAGDTFRVVGTITSLSTQSISELVLYTALTGGVAFLREVFANPYDMVATASITFTVDVDWVDATT